MYMQGIKVEKMALKFFAFNKDRIKRNETKHKHEAKTKKLHLYMV